MTPAQRTRLSKRLDELRDELLEQIRTQRIEPTKPPTESSRQDEDEAPLTEMMKSIASGRTRAATLALAKIEKAKTKLREEPDDFGLCEDCGDPIASKRLEAVPYAEYCIVCQAKADGPKGPQTRKSLTDYK